MLFINPVPLLAGTAHPPIDCASRAEKAFNLHLSGHSQLALDSFNACLKKNSKDKNTLLFFIKLLPENSSSPYYTDLFKLADASIKEKNTGLIPYLSLCKYYRNKNQLNSAFANCKKALMIDPISYAVYRELGLTYSKSKNPQKAIENFNRAINISSANYKARYMAAEEYFKIKNNKPALKNYLKAFNLMPSGARNTAFASHLSKRIKMTRNRIAKKNKLRQKGSVRAEKAKNEKCIAKAEKYARQDRLEEAYAQISTCLKRDKSNSKARMFSADIL
ncbi:MAG: hypothetical protein U9Q34_05835, partial [Elusimicrobiota bacterium]|nr:hypothetical protein [Elusimicrobiota bacterium]